MSKIKRSSNLFVRTNASGEIVSVFWPHEQQNADSILTGVALPDGEQVYEVAVPENLYSAELTADLFSNYDLRVDEQGKAALARRSTKTK